LPLPVYLPPGAPARLESLATAINERPGFFEVAFAVTEYVSDESFQIGALTITPHPVGHYVPAWSMDIRGPAGERIVYAGDMGPSEMVVELAREADLLILEATLESAATDDARRGHLSTEEAIDHVRTSGARRGLLVHYPSERRAAITDLCAASGVPVEPARSGMVVEVVAGGQPGSASPTAGTSATAGNGATAGNAASAGAQGQETVRTG
jgi:ribonuclease BN (tRNA processing enzyme)